MARTPNSSPQTRELLLAMAVKRRVWHHGYQLSKETCLTSGTLSLILIRLSDQGMLESKWQEPEPGKPARHAYRLTADGLAFVRTLALMRRPAVISRKIAGATI